MGLIMSEARAKAEKEYKAYDKEQISAGESLFQIFQGFYRQYCSPHEAKWENIDVKYKLVWVRTAKSSRYLI